MIAIASAWLAASLTSAEAPPPASAPTPAQSIESAKKEFEALKAAREAAQRGQGSTALPRLSVPELQTGLGDPLPAQGTKANPAVDPTKKSANWLVDGMTKEAVRRDGDRSRSTEPYARDRGANGSSSDETGVSDAASANDPRNEITSTRDSRSADHSDREKSAEAPNPLNRYLAAWMTPRDYATLKPSLTEGLSAHGAAQSSGLGEVSLPASLGGGLSGVTLPGGIAPPGADPLSLSPKGSSPAISPPRENPYLQSFALPAAPATTLPATPPASAPFTVAPVMSPMPSPTPAAPAAKPAVPDFARPAQDEKYFKQLKRF